MIREILFIEPKEERISYLIPSQDLQVNQQNVWKQVEVLIGSKLINSIQVPFGGKEFTLLSRLEVNSEDDGWFYLDDLVMVNGNALIMVDAFSVGFIDDQYIEKLEELKGQIKFGYNEKFK
jgi:hypothetical protein